MIQDLAILILAAFALDFIFGDPPNRFHPVCFAGWWANLMENIFRKLGNGFIQGMLASLMVLLPLTSLVLILVYASEKFGGLAGGIAAASVVLYVCFAPAGLALHAKRVLSELKKNNIEGARKDLGMMVGRNTSALDEKSVVKACVESVAENYTDGVASPLFFAVVGFVIAGSTGAAAFTVFYRASNTLDSMWGKLNDRYRHFGTFAARLDDILNFIPARMALPVVAFSALMLGLRSSNSLKIGFRDSDKHESPNSAWTEAAFSGALGIQLGGSATYGERIIEHPLIGEALEEPIPEHICKAVRLMILSSLVFATTAVLLGTGLQYLHKHMQHVFVVFV